MTSTASTTAKLPTQVLIIGDSQGQGPRENPSYPSSLCFADNPNITTMVGYMAGRGELVNGARAGYNSSATADLLPALLTDILERKPDFKPAYAVVVVGSNDALSSELPSRQHVPLDEFTENLETIRARLEGFVESVIFVTPPPAAPSLMDPHTVYRKACNNKVISSYASAIKTFVHKWNSSGASMKLYTADLNQALTEVICQPDIDASEYYEKRDGLHLRGKSFHVLESQIRQLDLPGLTSHGEELPTVLRLGQNAPHFLHWRDRTSLEQFHEVYRLSFSQREQKEFIQSVAIDWVRQTELPDCLDPSVTGYESD